MPVSTVRVPESILCSKALSATAKLLWTCLQLDNRREIRALRARSGLSPATIQRGLAELAAAEIAPVSSEGRSASLPTDLLRHRKLHTQAKLLYGILQLTPGFEKDSGSFTYLELESLAGVTAKPLRQAARALQATGWLELVRGNKYKPMTFTLRDATTDQELLAIDAMDHRLAHRKPYGETLMREYLDRLIDSDNFTDNARPGFLINPWTGEKLELDRYYPPKVAFEFQGEQHDGPTERYPSESEAAKQQARDAMKMDMCKRRGITLITLRRQDLTLKRMKKKVIRLPLPLKDVNPKDPVVAHLERLSREHRNK